MSESVGLENALPEMRVWLRLYSDFMWCSNASTAVIVDKVKEFHGTFFIQHA